MNSNQFLQEILEPSQQQLVVAMAVTRWSAGAIITGDQVEEFVKTHDNVTSLQFDIEENPELLRYFRIGQVPTVIVLKNREVVDVISGLINKKRLFNRLNKHLA